MSSKRPSLRDRPVLPAVGRAAADDLLLGAERRRQEVQDLPVNEIMPNRRQPRTRPSDEGLADLAASITEHGLLQPILVQAMSLKAYEGRPCRYEIIAGERRWRASLRAGKTVIPAIVFAEVSDDRQMLVLALIENLQREELSPLDEGLAFAHLQSELGLTQHEIAARVGKSRGYVQNRIRLTTVPDDLRQLVAERPDTIAHIYEIARIDDPQARADLIAAVRDNRISHAEIRARVSALLTLATSVEAPNPGENDLRKSILGGTLLPVDPADDAQNDLRKSILGVPPLPVDLVDDAQIDLRKSFSGMPTPPVDLADDAQNDLRKSISGEPLPPVDLADDAENDLRKSISGEPLPPVDLADDAENDLRKSILGGTLSPVDLADDAENDLRKSISGVPPPPVDLADDAENDLRKSIGSQTTTVLSSTERSALTAVAIRLEAGMAISEGEDRDLLIRIAHLVVARIP